MIQQEIQRVINLPVIERVGQKWAGLHQRPSGSIWMNDSVMADTKHLRTKNPGFVRAKSRFSNGPDNWMAFDNEFIYTYLSSLFVANLHRT